MGKLKTGLFAVTGLAVGAVLIRRFRKQRTAAEPDGGDTAATAQTEAKAAVEHARAAVSHARIAGKNAVGYANEEVDEIRVEGTDGDAESSGKSPVRRLRKVGKGWVRR